MANIPEYRSGAPVEPSYDEAAVDRQIDRMVEQMEARLPEGYEFDWERGAGQSWRIFRVVVSAIGGEGQSAYPNATSKLFQILHLIYALNSVMKEEQVIAWLNEPDDKNPFFTRLDTLAQPDGPALVSQQASHLLFPPPPSSLPSPDELRKELELIDLEEQGWMEPGESPRQYSARPRRQRPDREFE